MYNRLVTRISTSCGKLGGLQKTLETAFSAFSGSQHSTF